jgi:hypothetical protein
MNLPRRVQEQLDAAERMEAELAQRQQAGQREGEEPAAPDPEAANGPEAQEQVQVRDEGEAQQPRQDEVLAHKYRTLEGKYNAEVPALHQRLRERDAQMSELAATVEKLKQEAAQRTPPPKPEPVTNPKDVEDFGADLVEMVTRAATGVFEQKAGPLGQKFDALVARIDTLEQHLSGVGQQQAQSAEQQFYSALAQAVPDWEKINVEEGWLAWLQETDPVYGRPRQAALDEASRSRSVPRVVAIFNAYKATKAPAAPAAPAKNAPSKDLARQVSPSKTGSQSNAPNEPQRWTEPQIMQFYDDLRRGKFDGRDDEAQRIEAEIDAAVAEGRVAMR